MALRLNTAQLIQKVSQVINSSDVVVTVRQVYYQIFVENGLKYNVKQVGRAIKKARELELIPDDKIIDRTRPTYEINAFNNLTDFLDAVRYSYHRNVIQSQPMLIELWCEKDALSETITPITYDLGVPLSVTRGFPSTTFLVQAGKRATQANKPLVILYFGDFDPSGEAIYEYISRELPKYTSMPVTVIKVALTKKDITNFNLPTFHPKEKDTRTKKFEMINGILASELDALNPKILHNKIKTAIKSYLDQELVDEERAIEKEELSQLENFVCQWEQRHREIRNGSTEP
jgi:hypothetical protein